MPQISVIVPVYNVEPYLRRCIDSVLAQTFVDFELILVDDGSPDNCGAICDEYAEKDARIHVIHQPNGGLSAARNTGIDWAFANSDSEWLAFVDSDDWVHPQYLQFLHKAVSDYNAKISVCNYEVTDTMHTADNYSSFTAQLSDGLSFYTSEERVIPTVTWNKLYNKDLFCNHRFPVGRIHEDEFTTYKLLYAAGRVVYVDARLYYYYLNQQGLTKSQYSLKRLDKIAACEEQCQFFNSIGQHDLYEKWVSVYLLNDYTFHISQLRAINEMQQAEALRRRGQRLILKNFAAVNKRSKTDKNNLFLTYFPRLYRSVSRFNNLFHLLSTGGLKETASYYKRKLKNRK